MRKKVFIFLGLFAMILVNAGDLTPVFELKNLKQGKVFGEVEQKNNEFIFHDHNDALSLRLPKSTLAAATLEFEFKTARHGMSNQKLGSVFALRNAGMAISASFTGRTRSLLVSARNLKTKDLKRCFVPCAEWPANEWRRLVFAWGDGVFKTYVDGIEKGSFKMLAVSPEASVPTLNLGCRNPNCDFNGIYRNVRFFDKTLSVLEVKKSYETTAGEAVEILVARYPFIIGLNESVKLKISNFREKDRKFKLKCSVSDLSVPSFPVLKSEEKEITLNFGQSKELSIFEAKIRKRPFGLYEAKVELFDDSGRLAGDVKTFGVAVPAPKVDKNAKNPFGVWDHAMFRKGEMHYDGLKTRACKDFDALKILGHNFVRTGGGFSWFYAEPEPGKYDWSHADKVVAAAEKGNFDLLATLCFPPFWADCAPREAPPGGYAGYSTNRRCGYAPAKKYMKNWRDFVFNIVSRYKGRVKYWNIWNEPCFIFLRLWDPEKKRHLALGSTEQAKMYYDLLKLASEAIREADPEAKIVADTGYYGWATKLFSFNNGDIVKYVDIFCWHFYCQPRPEKRIDEIRKLKAFIKKAGGNPVLWDTETGRTNTFRTSNRPMLPADAKVIAESFKKGRPKNSEYFWMSPNVDEFKHAEFYVREMVCKIGEGIERIFNWGAADFFPPVLSSWPDGSPTISAIAARFLHHNIVGADFIRQLKTADPDNYAYLFKRGEKYFMICWNGGEGGEGTFLSKSGALRQFDLFGNPMTAPTVNAKGILELKLDGSPVYVMDLDPGIKAIPAMFELSGPEAIQPSKEIIVKAKIKNVFKKALTGEMKVASPSGWICDPSSFKVECPSEGEIETSFKVTAPADAAARREITLKFSLNGFEVEHPVRVKEVIYAERLKTALPIDATLAKWPKSSPAVINKRPQVIMGLMSDSEKYVPDTQQVGDKWRGPGDMMGEVYCAWDEKNLYLAAKIKDDHLINKQRFKAPYNGDCFELFMDVSKFSKLNHIYQVMFVAGLKEREEPSHLMFQGGKSLVGEKISSKVTSEGYNITMAIPWENFGDVTPKPGLALPIEFCLNDADPDWEDGGKSKVKMSWHGQNKDPFGRTSGYGLLILK